MKKNTIISMLTIFLCMVSVKALAYDCVVNGVYYNLNMTDKTASVTSSPTKYSGIVHIPEEIEFDDVTYSVTSIGNNAFENSFFMTKVTIGNNVTEIGYQAFRGCGSLTELTIPNSVISIGDYAFQSCSLIKGLTIPSSVTSIGFGAFFGCSFESIVVESDNPNYDSRENCNALILTDANRLIKGCNNTRIPNSVTRIASEAFAGCIGLTEVIIPDGVTFIDTGAFQGCTGLTEVTIPNSVTYIGSQIFKNCSALTKVVLSDNASFIGGEAFYNCTALTEVNIPNSAMFIGHHAFYYCSSLIEISIPNSVTEIQNNAFQRCYNLTKLTLSNGVKKIGEYAFDRCQGLTEITIPNSVIEIDEYAFSDCSITDVTISDGIEALMSASYSFRACPIEKLYLGRDLFDSSPFVNKSELKALTIGNMVKSLYGFGDCKSLTEVTIPNNVVYIGSGAFYNCSGLVKVVIGDNVAEIGSNAFYRCYSMTNVTIPNSVTKIGKNAFEGCSGLTEITIPNSITSIEDGTFKDCNHIKNVVIPSSVTKIGNNAFNGTTDLVSFISLNTTPPEIQEQTFYIVIFWNGAILHVPAGCKSAYEQAPYWQDFFIIQDDMPNDSEGNEVLEYDFEVDGIYYNYGTEPQTAVVTYKSIPDRGYSGFVNIPEKVEYNGVEYAVTEINEYTFMDCTGLTKVNIPNSVKYIGRFAFENTGLIEVVIPNSVVEIGPTAFEGCKELTSVILSDNVTKIDEVTFMNCSNLTELVIGNSVTDICMFAFWGCSKLASVTIPNSVVSIASYAFSRCSSLTELVIGNSVAFIGDNAFEDCSSLVSITSLNPTPPEIERFTFDTKTYQTATLHVMTGSKSAYEQAPYWQNFFNIQEEGTDGVGAVITDKQEKNEIYTLGGVKLNTTKLSDLAKGIYIVNGRKYVVR